MTTAFKPLTKDDIAEVLDVSIRTIENWVNDGTLPAPKKLGNRVYWHPNAFYAWLDQCLTADTEVSQNTSSSQEARRVKPQRSNKAGPAKTELEKMRARSQAQLDALLT